MTSCNTDIESDISVVGGLSSTPAADLAKNYLALLNTLRGGNHPYLDEFRVQVDRFGLGGES
jgi:hypothetical protein